MIFFFLNITSVRQEMNGQCWWLSACISVQNTFMLGTVNSVFNTSGFSHIVAKFLPFSLLINPQISKISCNRKNS